MIIKVAVSQFNCPLNVKLANDRALSIQLTIDGGYIIAGSSGSKNGDVTANHGNNDVWVTKLSATNAIEWQKSYGGTDDDWAESIKQTTDGGYIITGFSASNNGDVTVNHGSGDFWTIKINSFGFIQWQKSFGGSFNERAYSVKETTDAGYIIAGLSGSIDGDLTGNPGTAGDYNVWVIKLDVTGTILWKKLLGGTKSEYAYSINQTTDGGYVLCGESSSNDGDISANKGNRDFLIVKLNPTGDTEWLKTYGGANDDYAINISQTTDGGYIVAGSSSSGDGDITHNNAGEGIWILKLNPTGDLQWQKSLGGSSTDEGTDIKQTIDGGYVVAGITYSNDGDISGNHGGYEQIVLPVVIPGDLSWFDIRHRHAVTQGTRKGSSQCQQ